VADDDDAADAEVGDSTAAEPESGAAEAESVHADPTDGHGKLRPQAGVRLALAVGMVVVLALGGLFGWLGYRAYESHEAKQQRDLFLRVGRQVAMNLTTISSTEAEADVQRILDSATGAFYDEFQKRSASFVEVVKQAQSKSEGTVTEAGLEPGSDDQGRVLVAVTVHTQNAGAPEQRPRAWRMRIIVQKVGDDAKVSRVEFIP
jgi:Mce-associated membrane protein